MDRDRAARPLPMPFDGPPKKPFPRRQELKPIQKHVARLYAAGFSRLQIQKALLDKLTPTTVGQPVDMRMRRANRKLKAWEGNQRFRDEIFNKSLANLDLDTPAILKGVSKAAQRGRIDAAKFALEMTGRYVPKSESVAPNVVIAVNGVPRPPASDRTLAYTAEDEDVVEEQSS